MTGKGRYITPDAPPDTFECREFFIPSGQTWWAILTGALLSLTEETNFEQVRGISTAQTAGVFQLLFDALVIGRCPMFAGMIALAARESVPNDQWLLCDGAAYFIDQYPALYNAIGTTYGDDGTGTFCVPDLRGRFPLGAGAGTGLTNRVLASTGGEETHTLTSDELPEHAHQIDYVTGPGTANIDIATAAKGSYASKATGDWGGGQAHNTVPPYLVLNAFIYAG